MQRTRKGLVIEKGERMTPIVADIPEMLIRPPLEASKLSFSPDRIDMADCGRRCAFKPCVMLSGWSCPALSCPAFVTSTAAFMSAEPTIA